MVGLQGGLVRGWALYTNPERALAAPSLSLPPPGAERRKAGQGRAAFSYSFLDLYLPQRPDTPIEDKSGTEIIGRYNWHFPMGP